MKHIFALLSAVFIARTVFGYGGVDAVLDVLDSRFMDNPALLEKAAAVVAEDAASGKPLQRFIAALYSAEPSPPAAFRISAAVREKYLAESRQLIEYAADKRNNPLAVYLLAIERNDRALLKKAVDLGNIQAMVSYATIRLSELDEDGSLSQKEYAEEMEKVFALYSKVAEKGNQVGINNLGVCYRNGIGCEKNLEKAFECFKKAMEKGNSDAMNNIAEFYKEGLVVEKDPKAAVKCFVKSAATGNTWGKFNYAICLLKGEGIEKNAPCAVELLMSMAKRGVPEAMDVLSKCYEKGDGVRQDVGESLKWHLRAKAANGDESAKKWLEANGDAP